jgi:hypothetical protein
MNKLLEDVMRLAAQLPERDQQYIAGAVIRTIQDLLGPSWAERVREADVALLEVMQAFSRMSRQKLG